MSELATVKPFTPQEALNRVIEHREIFHDEMVSLMHQIMAGEVSPVLIAAIITGLRVKKETIGEIAAAASVMRELSTKVPVTNTTALVDTCGTGGDGAHTFNISTAAMFVAAAGGVRIAKHGGRSVSSQSGSADVLEALGANINLTPEQVAACIDQVGVGFMFAPNHHSAMKHAAPVRRELGVRTIFNILGPLTNPASAPNQVLGVFHPDLVGIQVRVLQRLGSQRALTVFGREGLDEISVSGPTLVGELKDGQVSEYEVTPAQFGLATHAAETLQVADVASSRAKVLAALTGEDIAARDIVALNAGASLYVAGRAETLAAGVQQALALIASGAARAKVDEFVACTQTFPKAVA
ncbi:MAG: anthranilate phosphoribosyltransferase [Pseudomonadota bacterium]|jgi:anthranilate phosphoribosyltransferase